MKNKIKERMERILQDVYKRQLCIRRVYKRKNVFRFIAA